LLAETAYVQQFKKMKFYWEKVVSPMTSSLFVKEP
jgi:hypothetical protein